MTPRQGHARPVGTTWRMRLHWQGRGEPQLGDVVYEVLDETDVPETMQRGFAVVGVEEPAPGRRWVVMLERLTWDDFVSAALKADVDRVWTFIRDR